MRTSRQFYAASYFVDRPKEAHAVQTGWLGLFPFWLSARKNTHRRPYGERAK
jgi:hypothetical protein